LKQYVSKADKSEWKKLGIKFYKRSQFELAHRCFQVYGDETLINHSQAAVLASKAGEKLRMLTQYNNKETTNINFIKEIEKEMKYQFVEGGHIF